MIKYILILVISTFTLFPGKVHAKFKLLNNNGSTIYAYQGNASVVKTALNIVKEDFKLVGNHILNASDNFLEGSIIIGTLGQNKNFDKLLSEFQIETSDIDDKWEAFKIQVVKNGKKNLLFVIGSDNHGTAYGVLELSRIIGVSPWQWWADVHPQKKENIYLPIGYKDTQFPSVKFRGIFINDEDWGLTPWSAETFEPNAKIIEGINQNKMKGMRTIGPKTYSKIFELLLRLRANTIWPAMHEVTVPFYFTQGNREIAKQFGIYIGSAHNEALARNSATEWDISGIGPYNYLINKKNILQYWEQRLIELKDANNIFTMGMRGKHDGPMEGVNSTEEYRQAIDNVLTDQTELLKKHFNKSPSEIPQVVIPYKEVLDVYKAGMNVPDYVTLMWCDDNYGYITHFPDEKEKARKGGNGVYYHISYWGRPHDYLWLSTTNPALIHHQMNLAYQYDAKEIWIVNVGDIKPGEYQIELFLDMAWNINNVNKLGTKTHLFQWLKRNFNEKIASKAIPIVQEHYRLAYIRKPEFMGNTRVEEIDPEFENIKDLPWTEKEVIKRISDYERLSENIIKLEKSVNKEMSNSFFELIKYPILGAAEMNKKFLYGQLARHGLEDWRKSHTAHNNIISLTEDYNNLLNGKWRGIMDYRPRRLTVFDKLTETNQVSPKPSDPNPTIILNGSEFKGDIKINSGLGYEGKAVTLSKGSEIKFNLGNKINKDSITIELRLLPNHPIENGNLRLKVGLDENQMHTISYNTIGRSEEWKENVLRNQAIKKIRLPIPNKKSVSLKIQALDVGVVLDQVALFL